MQTVITAPPRIENDKKHSLGHRAFLVFLARRIKFALFLFALTLAAWYAQQWIPAVDADWGAYAERVLLAVSIAYFVFVFMETYLEYRYYTYLFTEEAFIMTYGYVVRNEIATLYHHIQNVNIERSVIDRMIGVSKIIILMTGSDRDTRRNQIVLPAIGRKKAKLVQTELLRRARRHASSHPDDED
ncbi:MAG TPA: PH domain-containing protein [Candidatus Paceibacterota bacterium]|nr:PH domain-containing protein [Candidatus Paceibacterota bacterium]